MSAEWLHCPHLPVTFTSVRSPGRQGLYSILFPTAALQQAFSFSEALHAGSEEEVMPQSRAVKRFFQDSWIQCKPELWVTESAYPSPSNAVELCVSPGNSLHRHPWNSQTPQIQREPGAQEVSAISGPKPSTQGNKTERPGELI